MSEAQDINQGPKLGQIGFFVAEPLEPIYREIAGLLGIPFDENLRAAFDEDKEVPLGESGIQDFKAIIVDGVSLTHLKGLILNLSGGANGNPNSNANPNPNPNPNPLILICGPVSGETSDLWLKTMPFNLGLESTRLLMEGREFTEADVSEPTLDLMLEDIREVLRHEVTNFVELPPIPWGYSYAMALTHDIDILSLKEMPIARTFLGYFYRSSVLNWKRWRAGKVQTTEFSQTIWEMARTWLAKVGIGKDVWQRALPGLMALEKRLGVRSSLYFMAFPEKPGILPERLRTPKDKDKDKDKNKDKDKESAPTNRASFYDVTKHSELINSVEDGGWEAGVHGIDAWHDGHAARIEHGRVAHLTGQDEIGVRMHWLYFQSPNSFEALEEGGFLYDTTVGFNEVVGFRAGTLQPYHPLNCQTLWELPLHIQDGALLGEEHLDLNCEDAFHKAKPILDYALRFGGTVSLLWHNQSFTAPRFWGEVYERLIAQGKQDGAWIAVPRDILRWFTLRRKCEVRLSMEGTHWQITCAFPDPADSSDSLGMSDPSVPSDSSASQIPAVRVRLHIEPKRVKSASVPYEAGDGYLDFAAQALVTLEVEGED